MTEKQFVIAIYALLGVLIAAWPIVRPLVAQPRLRSAAGKSAASPSVRFCLVVASAAVIFGWAFGPVYALPASLYLGYLTLRSCRTQLDAGGLLGAALALAAAATLPWWRHQQETTTIVYLSWTEALFFLAVLVGIHHVFTRQHPSASPPSRNAAIPVLIVAAGALSIFLSFATGIYQDPQALNFAWHHWGAYIGPSELLLAGGRIFLDFPAQYGLGPTLLIAAACGNDCWTGMYFIVGFSLLAFAVTLGLIVRHIVIRHSDDIPTASVVLLAVLLCGFFWNSFPPMASTAAITPSTNGLRFLPVLALAAYLLIRYTRSGRNDHRLAHGAWAVCALWSPESAFMASFLWWPFYIWLCRSQSGATATRRTVLRSMLTLLLIAIATAAAFLAGYWALYQTLPSLRGYLAFLLHPPGMLPINPWGPVWFFAAGLAAGGFAMHRSVRHNGNHADFNQRYILMLLAYGTLSYFLGRSHDNNILNILPFLLPLLLSSVSASVPAGIRSAGLVMVASLIGWTGVFGWHVWGQAFQADRLFETAPGKMLADMSYANKDSTARIRAHYLQSKIAIGDFSDAARAIGDISSGYHEPVTMMNITYNMIRSDGHSAWSALNNPATYKYLPPEFRREFIRRTADRLGRPGWLLVDRRFPDVDLIHDMESAYAISHQLDFGSYFALRLVPRTVVIAPQPR